METTKETTTVKVLGLAPPDGLQNIFGGNWSTSPGGRQYVTYCYLESIPLEVIIKAIKLNATLRTENVYTDNNRYTKAT